MAITKCLTLGNGFSVTDIKNKNSSETLLPDDAVNDLTKESQVNLLQLNPVEVSTQLMVEDFTTFRQ